MDNRISTTAEAAESDALPRAHAVHCDPATHSAETGPLPTRLSQTKTRSPAEWAYQRVILYIQNFEKQLDADHEIAMGFVGGAGGVLRIEGVGYFDPDIVTFYGTDGSGARTQMIQHVSQLNVALRAQPRPADQPEPRRIGFRLAADLEGGTGDPAPAPPASPGPVSGA